MVVDTSAIVAVLLVALEAGQFSRALADAPRTLMSAVTRVELSFVAEGRKGSIGRAVLEDFLRQSHIEVVPVSLQHAELAIDAFRRFGRGRHRAGLNIGDCFSYALAKATGEPLLFKGDDFGHTDIRPALPPASPAP
jgi:ribonuclease VapC